MRPLFVFLMITSSVVAIDNLKDYENLCGQSDADSLQKLVKGYSSESPVPSDQYSVGFHFNTKMCNSFDKSVGVLKHWGDFKAFTVFLSDNNQYLYIYRTLQSMCLELNSDKIVIHNKDMCRQYIIDGKNYLFVLWLKETKTSSEGSRTYKIEYTTTKSDSTQIKLLKRTDGQLFLRDLSDNDITVSSVETTNSWDTLSVNDSYFITCGQRRKKLSSGFDSCTPIEENYRIRCECDRSSNDIIMLVLIIFWAAVIIIATKPTVELMLETEKTERTAFQIVHNCNERNFKYKYLVVIRLSKTNADFDLKDVTIDVEFFTQTNESVAPNFRFSAKALESRPVTDIKLFMWRLTKMPELKRIQCAHSGKPDGKICLLGVLQICQYTPTGIPSDPIVWYKVVKNISRSPRHFNLRKTSADQDVPDAEERPIMGLTLNRISLSTLDIIFLLFIDILFMGYISSLIPINIYNVLIQMLSSIVLTTILGTTFHILFSLLYKYLLLMETSQQMKMHSQNEKICFIVIRVFYVIAFIAAVIFSANILSYRYKDPAIVIYRWVVVVFCSTTLTLLIWSVWSYWEIFFPSQRRQTDPSSLTVNSASVNDLEV